MLFLNFNSNQKIEKNVKMFLDGKIANVTPEKLKPFFDGNFSILLAAKSDETMILHLYHGITFVGAGYIQEIKKNHLIIDDNLSDFVDNFCLFDHALLTDIDKHISNR